MSLTDYLDRRISTLESLKKVANAKVADAAYKLELAARIGELLKIKELVKD